MIGRRFLSLILLFILIFTTNCASWKNQQGVTNKWRDDSLPQIEVGKTHQSLDTGTGGLELQATPTKAGQHTLEMR